MLLKKYLPIFFFSLLSFSTHAQFTITGQLKDTINEPVAYATVMLLNPKDSTLTNFTASDSKGNFAFKNIKKTEYILKITHFNYMPQNFFIQPDENKEMNMGTILMNLIAHYLMEVVIREAKAPIFFKGDTVEYDATTFKVSPGSTVEDLLRKLPGIEVDADGNIATMGREVRTVYVDGKSFFGNNPKTATQNLDAAAISKVQVFTEKSEQEMITGIADGSEEKAMNLELKEEYKKGYFGKATAGYGWGANAPHRWVAKGSFNRFTEKQQLSFIGYGNNLNQSSMSGEDRQDFYGQSMQSGRDNGDFGFRSSMRGLQSNAYNSSDGSMGGGFSNNGGGGVNYNYFNQKIKFNAGYFYSLNKAFNDIFSNRQTFLQDSSFWRIDTAHNERVRQNHSFSTRFESNIDTSNKIVVRANVEYSPSKRTYQLDQFFRNSEFIPINLHTLNNQYKNDNLDFSILSIYNHKFKKKRRTFAVSGFYKYQNGNNIENIDNFNQFFNATTESEQIKFLVENNINSVVHNVKSSVLYVEPLGKRFSLMGFYNFLNSLSQNNNFSTNPDDYNSEIDSLWLHYRYNTLYNRVGASANYAHNGINFSLGGAFQVLKLDGICETKPHFVENLNLKPYYNFIPYFSAKLEFPKKISVNASYSYAVSEPRISYLFPMPDLTNTMYKIYGNPNLMPERYHDIDARIYFSNRSSMLSVGLSGDATFYDSQIVYNRTTEYIEGQGYVTISKPDNVTGGNRFSTYLWTNFPIVKTKLTMNINVGGNFSHSPVFINAIENITNSKGYRANLSLNLSLGKKLSFTAGGNINQTFTQYSIQKDRNQSYIHYGANVSGKWQMFKKTFFEANYRFSNYTNSNLDYNQNIHHLNVSIRQVIGKKNQWELRLLANDILNQNENISQIAALNYIEYRTSPTLARYFMLTAAYNIRGFEAKNSGSNRTIIY